MGFGSGRMQICRGEKVDLFFRKLMDDQRFA